MTDPTESPQPRLGPGLVAAVAIGAVVVAFLVLLVALTVRMDSGWWTSMGGHMGSPGGSSEVSAESVPGAPTVAVRAGDLWFEPDAIEVVAGETTNLTVTNEGQVFHDLTIPDLDYAIDVTAGDTVTGALDVAAAGEYGFLCTVPGHADAGMRGTLVVIDQ